MPFNSYGFIFMLLPVTLAGFYLMRKLKAPAFLLKLWLIGMSLWFFALYGARNLIILLSSLAGNGLILWALSKRAVNPPVKGRSAPIAAAVGAKGGRESAFSSSVSVSSVPDGGTALTDNSGAVTDVSSGAASASSLPAPLLSPAFRKLLFAAAATANVILLGTFKYTGLAFPVAISFYTFEQISILADTYRGTAGHSGKPAHSVTPLNYILYLLYFPKILEGPIARYDTLAVQFDALAERKPDPELFLKGLLLFSIGLAKKELLADVIGGGADYAFAHPQTLTTLDTLVAIASNILQLYFDFSGYCDMGEGVSLLLGIRLPVNFSSPYRQEDMLSFWRHWHATLTSFFTDYVYIPLGGSRKGTVRTYINMLIIFALSGLWHGNTVNFLLWGILCGIFACIARAIHLKPAKGIIHYLRAFLTFILWGFSQVFFRAPTLSSALTLLGRIGKTKINPLFVTRDLFEAMVPKELELIMRLPVFVNTPLAVLLPSWGMLLLCLFIVFFTKNSHELVLDKKPGTAMVIWCSILFVWSACSITGISDFMYVNF